MYKLSRVLDFGMPIKMCVENRAESADSTPNWAETCSQRNRVNWVIVFYTDSEHKRECVKLRI
jgi:hypothetical protein